MWQSHNEKILANSLWEFLSNSLWELIWKSYLGNLVAKL